MRNLEKIAIKTEYIKLGQFLKFTGLIDSGSEEKSFLQNNKVLVNEVDEQRRGRKLYPKDKVEVKGQVYEISKDGN